MMSLVLHLYTFFYLIDRMAVKVLILTVLSLLRIIILFKQCDIIKLIILTSLFLTATLKYCIKLGIIKLLLI